MKTSSEEVELETNYLQNEIEKVKLLYDHFFRKISKKPPTKEHEDLKKYIQKFPLVKLKTTAHQFKFQALKNKFIQWDRRWQKTMQKIEEGTYERDLFQFKNKESAPPSESIKLQNQLELLYEKIVKLSPPQRAPAKDFFINSVMEKITAYKEKYPAQGFELRLQKESAGKFQLKIKAK